MADLRHICYCHAANAGSAWRPNMELEAKFREAAALRDAAGANTNRSKVRNFKMLSFDTAHSEKLVARGLSQRKTNVG